MPQRKLTAPLNGFEVPVVSRCPTAAQSLRQFREFQEKSRITYIAREMVKIHGRDWYCIAAYDANDSQLGNFSSQRNTIRSGEYWSMVLCCKKKCLQHGL